MTATTAQRYSALAARLRAAERPIRILRSVAWPGSVREDFLKHDAKRLPRVEYPDITGLDDCRAELARIANQTTADHPVEQWLHRTAQKLIRATGLLESRGTQEFFRHSRALYGAPGDPLTDETSTPNDLANRFTTVLDDLEQVDLGLPDIERRTARGVATALRRACQQMFGEEAPDVEVVEELSANAIAGARRVRVRRGARFSDRDVAQLVNHEVHVHVATSLNGKHQVDMPILAASHPGTTRTQEGLAVFAEFITGSMELDRLRRLTDRVVAINMAIEGADFIDVYRFFMERLDAPTQAFESTRRVFRGGVLSGGAPFTKDIVYLDGLIRVHNFLRVAVAQGRADCLRLLFCGKLDLEDIPALGALFELGLCRLPKYLPPWAKDLRFLLAYLAYSGFLNQVRLDRVTQHFEALMADAPSINVTGV